MVASTYGSSPDHYLDLRLLPAAFSQADAAPKVKVPAKVKATATNVRTPAGKVARIYGKWSPVRVVTGLK